LLDLGLLSDLVVLFSDLTDFRSAEIADVFELTEETDELRSTTFP